MIFQGGTHPLDRKEPTFDNGTEFIRHWSQYPDWRSSVTWSRGLVISCEDRRGRFVNTTFHGESSEISAEIEVVRGQFSHIDFLAKTRDGRTDRGKLKKDVNNPGRWIAPVAAPAVELDLMLVAKDGTILDRLTSKITQVRHYDRAPTPLTASKLPLSVKTLAYMGPEIYQFGELAGAGGTAEVWRATDLRIDRTVAIKVFKDAATELPGAIEHARGLARVKTRHVVQVYDICMVDDPHLPERRCSAIVMEWVDGETLAVRLPGMTAALARKVGLALCDAVSGIHAAGVLHDDLHEENVMITPDDEVKVLDVHYRGTLALRSTATRETLLQRDVVATRKLLGGLLDAIGVRSAGSTAMRNAKLTIDALRTAFIAGLEDRSTGRAE